MNLLKIPKSCILVLILVFVVLAGCHEVIPVSDVPKDTVENSVSQDNTENEKVPSGNEYIKPDSTKVKHFFAGGVSINTGWQDIEKQNKPEDFMSCWLITASNMIEWWQNRYVESGNTLPQGTPLGKGSGPYQSAVFDTAILSFEGMKQGGNINAGLDWYINGIADRISNHSQPKPGTGGYLQSIDTKLTQFSKRPFSSYSTWEKVSTHGLALKMFSVQLLDRLSQGCVIGLDIKTHVGLGGALHAITLWGAEINEKNEVSKVYITDSDDYEHQLVECNIVADTDVFQSKVITMKVPCGEAYPNGATWEILRLYYLNDPHSLKK